MDKSPYAPYLYTNYTPSASEVLDIKDFLTEPLARLSTLDAEIQQLSLTMFVLNHQRHALSKEIEAHRALISPFRRLPLEIMAEIFSHCLPTDHNAVMSVKEAPLLLGRVCSAWRSITLSTPHLWASLHIPTPTPDSRFGPASVRKMATRCEAVREWILCSGKIPLSISLYTLDPRVSFKGSSNSDSDSNSQEDMESFGRVSRQIIPFSRQWKTVYLRAMESSFTPFQAMVKGDVPMLESLSIVNIPLEDWEPQTSSHAERPWKKSSGLLSAPKLRRLSLTHFSECLYNLPVRWSRLTHLKLDEEGLNHLESLSDLRYSHVFRVLKKCPLLVSCSFRLGNSESDTRVPSNSTLSPSQYALTLPLLEHLSLSLSGRSDEAFLKYLDLPALRHLEIKVQKEHRGHKAPENQRSVLMDLLSQNGTKLKKLFIEIWAMTEDVLIHCLKSVPSVTHLHLNNFSSGSVDEEIAYCLTPSKRNRDYLCPLLEEFHCEGSECASFSEEDLLSFIQKRHVSKYKNGGVLKRVNIIFHRNRPENVKEFFGSLEAVLDWEDYINLQFRGIGYKIDARISVESWLGHPTTTVDVKYVRGSLREYVIPLPSPRAGLDG
ncbi:uncharacterized protein LACBIDRAFT_302020 [Laccaria bicolor S238N-H82]|uniref:Predicted protein n=1 Tax=Laccaria bicolor (strain S238N-H82 / ATCC MYA-4686) TaxID=486041 RepID=B0CQD8_LACBS|nr:uncharacterized protein LACBIDRAFT_302020 [Laccaria bicolor S238N-H82]EDR15535.1 predicted protein [Laccaria bicolor S238N-H82]|eukprot:XP_001873743.1 predicted protein [Laccaria bicolor S238N-H82]